MKTILLLITVLILAACSTTHKQHLDFEGFTVESGIYKPKPGWQFRAQKDGSFMVAKDNSDSGGRIEPCECSLTTGGACSQATAEDEFGNITDIWCVDDGCGFCVGGVTEDPNTIDSSGSKIKFRLESHQRVKQ